MENRSRDNRNRNRGPRHHGDRNRHRQPHRGRSQRPLLTSAINAAGLTLVAMVLVDGEKHLDLFSLLGVATMSFGLSSIISYFAQRSSKRWIEKISDAFFLVGALIIVLFACQYAGFIVL